MDKMAPQASSNAEDPQLARFLKETAPDLPVEARHTPRGPPSDVSADDDRICEEGGVSNALSPRSKPEKAAARVQSEFAAAPVQPLEQPSASSPASDPALEEKPQAFIKHPFSDEDALAGHELSGPSNMSVSSPDLHLTLEQTGLRSSELPSNLTTVRFFFPITIHIRFSFYGIVFF
jgi:hypothetical protein